MQHFLPAGFKFLTCLNSNTKSSSHKNHWQCSCREIWLSEAFVLNKLSEEKTFVFFFKEANNQKREHCLGSARRSLSALFVMLIASPPWNCFAGTDVKDALVISVSTGTKCINGEYMSDRGLALNDCHAEIIARRCLLKFLYTQLELYLR